MSYITFADGRMSESKARRIHIYWDTSKVGNIGFDGYIGTCILWIYWIYRRYIGGYFFMNIDISKINKNTLKFINILSKSVKMTLIIKYIH